MSIKYKLEIASNRASRLKRAKKIGENALRLVRDFYKCRGGINDMVVTDLNSDRWARRSSHRWTIVDLDRALDEMEKIK